MCGIAGYILRPGVSGSENMGDAINCIRYRGPDGEGHYNSNLKDSDFEVALSHVRLAILDIEGGVQPMASSNENCTIVFNGEIYNFLQLKEELDKLGYEFNTNSDTEILLQAYVEWGEKCVEKLNGQFSFAIWDSGNEELFLARDHYGIKPLYYAEYDGGLVFASEIKSIKRIVPDRFFSFEESALADYLKHRYVPNPRTMFSGIMKMKPGHYGIWSAENGFTTTEFFEPKELLDTEYYSSGTDELVVEFSEMLDKAVSRRMVADVPFGAFLSGGIDSSAIVATMSKFSKTPIKTFSIGFEESNQSELEYARIIADRFNCDHHELIVSSDDLRQHLDELVRLRDCPVSEPSDIPIYLLANFASKHVKMVLTGEGADEILGGYDKYYLERYGLVYRKITPNFIRKKIIQSSINLLPERMWRWKFAINTLNMNDNSERMASWFGGMDTSEIESILGDGGFQTSFCKWSEGHSGARNLMNFDQKYWLPDNLLERGDRMSMAASLEARMPFMDVELSTFAAKLPDKLRVSGTQTKVVLRKSMEGILPKRIISRSKIGFRVPVREWFRGDLSDWLEDLLLSDGSEISRFLIRSEVKRIVENHRDCRENNEKVIWSLVTLEIFLRQNKSEILLEEY